MTYDKSLFIALIPFSNHRIRHEVKDCEIHRSAAPDIIGGIAAVASIIEDESVDDDTEYAREHVDSKALAEERERKEAHGIHMG